MYLLPGEFLALSKTQALRSQARSVASCRPSIPCWNSTRAAEHCRSIPNGCIHWRACRDDAPRHKNYQSTLMWEKLIPLTRAFFNAFLTLSEIAILVGKKNASEEPTIGTIEYFFIFSVESTALINMLLFTP